VALEIFYSIKIARLTVTFFSPNTDYYVNQVAGVRDWNLRQQQAYGICISLYEQHPISGKISGEL
jgi:hypothetical protein